MVILRLKNWIFFTLFLSCNLITAQSLKGDWLFDYEKTKESFSKITDPVYIKERDLVLSELSINPPYLNFKGNKKGEYKMKLLVNETSGNYKLRGDTLYLTPEKQVNSLPCYFKLERKENLLFFKLPEIPGMYFKRK